MAVISNKIALGSQAPDFSLLDTVSGKKLNLQAVKGDKATVVMFICNHCPFVKHVQSELSQLAKDYQAKGVGFVAISSNDIEQYPQDAPEFMKQFAEDNDFTFPYLFDETQAVAKNYDAACTPDFSVYDKDLKLAYHGQLDDARPKNDTPVTGADVRNALDALLKGASVTTEQKPSMGCGIKWKEACTSN